jgi:hypothetical protein
MFGGNPNSSPSGCCPNVAFAAAAILSKIEVLTSLKDIEPFL